MGNTNSCRSAAAGNKKKKRDNSCDNGTIVGLKGPKKRTSTDKTINCKHLLQQLTSDNGTDEALEAFCASLQWPTCRLQQLIVTIVANVAAANRMYFSTKFTNKLNTQSNNVFLQLDPVI
ncbi:Chaperone protein ClpB [Trichinella spiralis]|uniref:Chaperone protein ClpB n=1 Tax=Trichinella spiralis TaxID=6334 RepID=A0ABR3L0R0_TRISP